MNALLLALGLHLFGELVQQYVAVVRCSLQRKYSAGAVTLGTTGYSSCVYCHFCGGQAIYGGGVDSMILGHPVHFYGETYH